MIGRSTCAVTRCDLVRVSHSWTPQLNILEILKHFWPASEPCRRATIKDIDFIFPVRTLPSLTCPPRKYEGMDMHSSSTVVCKIWGQFRCYLVLYGSKCPIHGHAQLIDSSLSNLGTISLKSGTLRVKMSYSEGGPSNGQISKRLIDTAQNHSGSIQIWSGDLQL